MGRPPYYDGRKAKCICRTCDAGPDEVDKTERFICHRIIQADIEKLIEGQCLDELKQIYQTPCPNAFFKLDFGGSPFGIFSAACPTEGLHQLEKGLMQDCLSQLFNNLMSSSSCSELD